VQGKFDFSIILALFVISSVVVISWKLYRPSPEMHASTNYPTVPSSDDIRNIFQHELEEYQRTNPPRRIPAVKTTTKQEQPPMIISAPNGIAIGGGTVTNPTVNNYDVAPQIVVTRQKDNVPSGDLFITVFRLDIIASKAFLLHVRAVSPDIAGASISVDNVRPPGQGGIAIISTGTTGVGFVEEDFRDVESGAYTVTARTLKPIMVRLECH
jgi:hypothetical protein